MRFWNRTEENLQSADWAHLMQQKRKGGLLPLLQEEAKRYTADDLDVMMTHYAAKIKDLPEEYRKSLAKYARIQIIEGYNRLLTASFPRARRNERLPECWMEYALFAKKEDSMPNGRIRSLKHLIAAFMIFIEEKPPHPEGMPFPGGLSVECLDGVYYCPVKDTWTDEESALCRFCPALQSRERDMVLSKAERDAVGKREKITNYFYNFKG